MVVCFVAVGCGSSTDAKYSLQGSLQQEMDLGFDKATLVYSGDSPTGPQFSISFDRTIGNTMGVNTILEVAVTLDPTRMEALKAGIDFDLSQKLSNGQVRGTVSRNVLDDPRTTFPPFRQCGSYAADGGVIQASCAQLELYNVPKEGENLQAAGTLHLTFADGIDFASGRTVFGNFNANFP